MTMITPSYLGETIEYSSLHACRSTLEDPTVELEVSVVACERSVRRDSAGCFQNHLNAFQGAVIDIVTNTAADAEDGSPAGRVLRVHGQNTESQQE